MPDPGSPKPLLVALGADAQALRLVHAAFWTSREKGCPWVAVHVEVPGEEEPEDADQARLWLEEATSLGAQTLWIQARTPVAGLIKALQRTGADEIHLGRGRGHWPWNRLGHSTLQELRRRQPGLRLVPMVLDSEIPRPRLFPPRGQRLGAVFGGLGVLGACAGFSAILPPEQPLPAILLIFLLGTAFIADRWGLGVGALGILLSSTLLDFVLAQPFGSLAFNDPPLLVLFVILLLGGQLAVALTQRLRQQTRASRRRAAQLAALLLLGRSLAKATTPQDVAEALAHLGERLLHRRISLLLPTGSRDWRQLPEDRPFAASPGHGLETLGQKASGGGLEPFLDGAHAFLPLGHGEAPLGALCLPLARKQDLREESWELLRAFALQVALALERVRWLAAAQQTLLENETERMRSALLGAISHDLRTPLAGIQGAASSLLLAPEALGEPARRDLLAMIHDESERLTQLLSNLLELTRLESGAIRVHKEWQPLEEVLGSALRRAEAAHGPLAVELDLPADLPLVPVDGVLLEQLLINLLVNAHRYAPESPVGLRAWIGEGTLELAVSDRGPGIPEELRERVFEKFFRIPGRSNGGGVGLGLAICDAIARTHGGRIWARARSEGEGAMFRVSLPLEGTPPALPEGEEAVP